jgi:hypothetical protein
MNDFIALLSSWPSLIGAALALAFLVTFQLVRARARRRELAALRARIEAEQAEYERRLAERRASEERIRANRLKPWSVKDGNHVPTNGDVFNFWDDLRTFAESLPQNDTFADRMVSRSLNAKAAKHEPAVTPNVMPQKRGQLRSTPVPKTPRKNTVPKTAYTTASDGYDSTPFIAMAAFDSGSSYSDSGSSSCDSGGGGGDCG